MLWTIKQYEGNKWVQLKRALKFILLTISNNYHLRNVIDYKAI